MLTPFLFFLFLKLFIEASRQISEWPSESHLKWRKPKKKFARFEIKGEREGKKVLQICMQSDKTKWNRDERAYCSEEAN